MRICLFGGTFDPIHKAHLELAETARTALHLDRVLIIPAGHPPHKPEQRTTSYEHRLRMVELACKDHPALEPSRLEEGQGKSYSIDTIERVRSTLREEDELFFLIGADAFSEIRLWRRWEEVVRAVQFIVIARPGFVYDIPDGATVHEITGVHLAISSSAIRRAVATGEAPDALPSRVLEYIRRHGLYLHQTVP